MRKLRVANITTDSIVDGQGLRLVVFTQGSKRRCKGCHNPEMHDLYGFYLLTLKIFDLTYKFLKISGINLLNVKISVLLSS